MRKPVSLSETARAGADGFCGGCGEVPKSAEEPPLSGSSAMGDADGAGLDLALRR